MFSSTIQVLKVENEPRTSKRTGNEYQHFAARCVLLSDEGEVITVGSINSRRITPELRDSMGVGTFRATFAMQVPDFGNDKGDIVSILTGLTPIPATSRTAPVPPAQPAKS